MKARIALLLGGILAGLLLCELAVRALGLAPAVAVLSRGRFRLSSNPRIAYEPIPHLEYGGESLDFYQYRDRSNRLGYRGPSYAVAKPPGTRRIVVLGDSVAEGMRVASYDYVFSARVEERLRAHGLAVEVLNFGVSGYNTQQEVETLKEKALPFEPDLVVLAYCLNDRASPYRFLLDPLLRDARTWAGSHVSPVGLGAWLSWSAVYRLVRFRLWPERRSLDYPLDYRSYAAGDTVEASFRELARLAERSGFEVLVVVFPRFDDPTFRNYAYSIEHDFVRRLSEAQGFHGLDLLDAFRECGASARRPIFHDILHPSGYGHACAAAAITDYIERRVFLQSDRHPGAAEAVSPGTARPRARRESSGP